MSSGKERIMSKILIIGESCLDVFTYGSCNRLCPEAPVPVFNKHHTSENHGMAMNVYNNILSLGVKSDLMTNTNWRQIKKTLSSIVIVFTRQKELTYHTRYFLKLYLVKLLTLFVQVSFCSDLLMQHIV